MIAAFIPKYYNNSDDSVTNILQKHLLGGPYIETIYGLVRPYGVIDLGHYWFR